MEVPFQFFRTSSALISSKGAYLNESDYSLKEFSDLNNTGIALSSLLSWVNSGMDESGYNTTIAYNNMLQVDVSLMYAVLDVSLLKLP